MDKIPYAVFYKKINLPSQDLDPKSISSAYLTDIQGNYIELVESNNISNTLLFFDLAHKYSAELVFVNQKGEKYLIFCHHGEPLIREESMITDLCFDKIELYSDKEFEEDIEIDLDKFLKEKGNLAESLDDLVKMLPKKCQRAVIKGGNILFLLLCFHQLYGVAEEAYYKSPEGINVKIR